MDDSKHFAPDGREITEEMIHRWCEPYEKGEFPEGERTVGSVVYGQPPVSGVSAADGDAAMDE